MIISVYARLIHNPSLNATSQGVFAKAMSSFPEIIAAPANQSHQTQGIKALMVILHTTIEKLESMRALLDEQKKHSQAVAVVTVDGQEPPPVVDIVYIESARPLVNFAYVLEKAEEGHPGQTSSCYLVISSLLLTLAELRQMLRALIYGIRPCLIALRTCGVTVPDGNLMLRLFEASFSLMTLFDGDSAPTQRQDALNSQAHEVLQWLAGVFIELEPHTFQAMWTRKIEFYFRCAVDRPYLLNLLSQLVNHKPASATLVAILLRFLVDKLPDLGDFNIPTAAMTIRMFKIAFAGVTAYPEVNEPILATHIAGLIMDCFPLAAKATTPAHYFTLLKQLFRSIGGGAGKLEILYQEVQPLVLEMLENLNRQLFAFDAQASIGVASNANRELIVELCLTAPLRLSHLLPHLQYLMHPLTMALQSPNTELITQGLRTLELCIDNLSPEFLDPTLSAVLPPLMGALHRLLRPGPAYLVHSHAAIRILGKLGGRNRHLLKHDLTLKHKTIAAPATAALTICGIREKLPLGPVSSLSRRIMLRTAPLYQGSAYAYLQTCVRILLSQVNLFFSA